MNIKYNKSITLVGAAIGICAGIEGCEVAPYVLKQALFNAGGLCFNEIIPYVGERNDIPVLRQYFTSLAHYTGSAIEDNKFPIIVGGDHSIAIGSWSGVSVALANRDETLGLIWIDAHMDAHTPETTGSGNIHGMPVATLLGYGYKELISILSDNPKIDPKNIILIGIRSYESGEAQLLAKLGVKIYYNHDVSSQGFGNIFNEAIDYLSNTVDKIGLSIDLDGFDPKYVPGVGTPVADGVHFNEFIDTLNNLNLEKIIAVEIAECNLLLDKTNKTIKSVVELLSVLNSKIDMSDDRVSNNAQSFGVD